MPEPSILVAHRGFAGKFLENTLEALNEAVKLGVTKVEFDVQFTKDLVPIMLHDTSLLRTTGVDASIFSLNLSEVENVSSVSDVMVWLKANPEVRAFVELKPESIEEHGLLRCVKTLAEACSPAISQCVFISFDASACGLAKAQGFEKTGWVLPSYNDITLKVLKGLNPDYVFCDTEYIPGDLERLEQGEYDWVMYEVANRDLAESMLLKGADYLESKVLDELID